MSVDSTILVVEDEPAIAESVAYALRREGFSTRMAADFRSAYHSRGECDLIVLDLMLPDGSGFDLIEKMRGEGATTPIIVLSSRDAEADRVASLESGADDYVTKPFSPREIVARVRAVLRRTEGRAESRAEAARAAKASVPALRVALESRRAYVYGVEIELTRVEFDILTQLVETPGKVLTRQDLIGRVWGDGYAITDRTVDSHIKSLRRKVADAGGSPRLIETVRGVGYRVAEPVSEGDGAVG